MTNVTTVAANPLDEPTKRYFQLRVDGCFETFDCISVSEFSESDTINKINFICSTSAGNVQVSSYNDPVVPDRQTATLNMNESTFESIREYVNLAKNVGGSCTNARIVTVCGSDDKVIKTVDLPDFDLGRAKTYGAINKLGEGNATPNRISIASDYNGLPIDLNYDNIVCQAFENETGNMVISLYQCGNAVCRSGADACGDIVDARGICDAWYWWATDGVDNFLYESLDGGETYTLIETLSVATYGRVVYADCAGNIYTTLGVVALCGDDYELEPAITFPVAPVTGTDGIILFGNSGIYQLSERSGNWNVTNANDVAHPAQTVIDRDGDLVVTGGTNDGVSTGAYYMWSADGGSTWSTSNQLSIVGWSTTGDNIQSVKVTGSTVTFVINNGTDTRVYVTDNIAIPGVPDFYLSYGNAGTVGASVQILRPTENLSYLIIDCLVLINKSGLCRCEWEQLKITNDCLAQWAVCENDPLYLHRVYSVP